VNLIGVLACGNYGTETVQVDPMHPSNLYTEFNCQGIWKSTDYGATWTGPINTGSNGTTISDCAGGITVAPSSTANVPTIYESCIRGSGTVFGNLSMAVSIGLAISLLPAARVARITILPLSIPITKTIS
jgi:hypothetical protein